MTGDRVEALKALGLNNLEAEVYLFLLANEPRTAYKIGKALGKPTANVYKVVESLARKGALLLEEGENRVCAAVPVAEFTAVVARQFEDQVGQVRDLLKNLQAQYTDERIYQLQSVDLVLERCRSMLSRAEKVVVLDAFPEVLALVLTDVERAAARGVQVLLQVYAPVAVAEAETVLVPIGQDVIDHWQSQQLNLVVDGQELLVALLDSNLKAVHQALWSRSLYLACMLHAGFSHEHLVHRMLQAKQDPEMLASLLDRPRFFLNTEVPGKEELFRRFLGPAGTKP